ncbi:MAG: class 1 fructose-bisphosphatase [Chitinophagaceae bacterium]|nr:class 1 fructose-bisphosphatase [Chitinophagaceae bacterium]
MNINQNVLTLDEFRFSEQRNFPQATGELSNLLRDLAFAAKLINAEVSKAGLVDLLGDTGTINVQGEEVKKLDLFANQTLISCLKRGISCAGIVSEELDDVTIFDDEKSCQSKYIVAFDPLDGSSNIDNCISIGSIFGVYLRASEAGKKCTVEDFILEGRNMVAAGYVIYGSSTIFVYATTRSVNGFTLDPAVGEFFLSHPNIRCPQLGRICSVNFSNYLNYSPGVQQYLDHIQLKNKEEEGYYTQRHVASMVADLHRNLIKGGIFLNPATPKYKNGKLRLVYECMPWAFIYEIAGGKAIDGTQRVLDIPFNDLHQRTPFFIGSSSMIDELENYFGRYTTCK